MKLYLTRLVPQEWKSQRQEEKESGGLSEGQRSSRSAERLDLKAAEQRGRGREAADDPSSFHLCFVDGTVSFNAGEEERMFTHFTIIIQVEHVQQLD